jgi:hypothetical protein
MAACVVHDGGPVRTDGQGGGVKTVAEVRDYADADLISAAPELLAALKWALNAAELLRDMIPASIAVDAPDKHIARCRAAIAKAEGQS